MVLQLLLVEVKVYLNNCNDNPRKKLVILNLPCLLYSHKLRLLLMLEWLLCVIVSVLNRMRFYDQDNHSRLQFQF
jgi:hypothetical protein